VLQSEQLTGDPPCRDLALLLVGGLFCVAEVGRTGFAGGDLGAELVELHLVHAGEQRVGGHGLLAVKHALDGAAVWEGGQRLPGCHRKRWEVRESTIESRIFDGFGMELLVEPLVGAEGEHAVDVAWPGTKGEAVEELDDALAVGEWPESVGVGAVRGGVGLGVCGVAWGLGGGR
jgi:hypothetical protein